MLTVTIGLALNGLYLYTESGPLVAALRSGWLVVHVTTVSIGFGAFLTSGIVSVLYLIVCAAYLHARATAGWKGRAAAWVNVVGFVVMMFSLVFVNLVIAGLHS